MSTSQLDSATAVPRSLRDELVHAAGRPREIVHVLRHEAGQIHVALGEARVDAYHGLDAGATGYAIIAALPPIYPEWLGDRSFCETHRVRFPYVAGAMANGIASARLVAAMANAHMLAFFGAAGLDLNRVAAGLEEIRGSLTQADLNWGANLIHSPQEPQLEDTVVDLYLRHDVRTVCASAFMKVTPALVRYACTGLRQDRNGVHRQHAVFAKISRPEVAKQFMSPPSTEILAHLVANGKLSKTEAELAQTIAIAEDITVEADSGGHTDNRPLVALLPIMLQLRDRLCAQFEYTRPIRIGAAGGLGAPASVAAAFSLGAAYVLTGTVNQCTVESALSDAGKVLLAQAEISDVAMAPAPDMFEMGVKVQVLKRGTMFASRAGQLYELYRAHDSLEDISREVRERLERDVFQMPVDRVWEQTQEFFRARNPREIERAERDPKHRMALVFRWYLGKSSQWSIDGEPSRTLDYQIWCGPAMGAFNEWVRGSFLEDPAERGVVQVARNLMEGATVVTRAQQLRNCGLPVPDAAFQFVPRRLN